MKRKRESEPSPPATKKPRLEAPNGSLDWWAQQHRNAVVSHCKFPAGVASIVAAYAAWSDGFMEIDNCFGRLLADGVAYCGEPSEIPKDLWPVASPWSFASSEYVPMPTAYLDSKEVYRCGLHTIVMTVRRNPSFQLLVCDAEDTTQQVCLANNGGHNPFHIRLNLRKDSMTTGWVVEAWQTKEDTERHEIPWAALRLRIETTEHALFAVEVAKCRHDW